LLTRRHIVLCVAVVLGILLAIPGWTAFQVWRQSRQDEMRPADAIVVLGAAQYDGRPSPVLQARLDHALYLYRQGMAPLLVTTGGKEPGDQFTEAEAGESYLVGRGVASGRVLTEDQGRSSYESLHNVAAIARAHGIHSILLVSDPLHSARIKQMSLDLGFANAYTSPAGYQVLNRSTDTKLQELTRETASLTLYKLGLDRS
jgi:uncharacterized SAM-binding protein YcdF (DUF218 family)